MERTSWDALVYEGRPGTPLYSKVVCQISPQDLASLLDQYPQLLDHRSSRGESLLHHYCGDVDLFLNRECILLLLRRGFDWRVKNIAGKDARELFLSYAYAEAVKGRLRPPKRYSDGTCATFGYTVEDLTAARDEILREMDSR